MKKLTLVSIMCRHRVVTAFMELNVFDGKPVIYPSQIDKLFQSIGDLPLNVEKLYLSFNHH